MAFTLFPLSYKSGIKKDGTSFQPEYCTQGQWVRFFNGKIKKMGGMKILYNLYFRANYLGFFPINDNKTVGYLADTSGIRILLIDENFNLVGAANTYNINNGSWRNNQQTVFVQAAVVVDKNNQQYIVFLISSIAQDINQNTPSSVQSGKLGVQETFTKYNNNTQGIMPEMNGGLCYINPYLFLYGSNGLVQYSRSDDPFSFKGGDSGAFKISSDKVIYGSPIRGGSNSPSLLFWTLSSVVRVQNVGTAEPEFQIDVISRSSSIMSTRCVVEYDGVFFWPGTDRFRVFNGLVDTIKNETNLNYFYRNIDLDYRQQVFGVKQPKYGEIWWFYPEKIDTPGRDPAIPQGVNTRAIIFNKNNNSWYDTAISRNAGTYYAERGLMITQGLPLVVGVAADNRGGTWTHETSLVQECKSSAGPEITFNIPAYVKTPTVSWAAFNPGGRSAEEEQQARQAVRSLDRWVSLKRIEPDFLMSDDDDKMQVSIVTKEYAQSPELTYGPYEFTGKTPKLDFNLQGRHMSFVFEFNGRSSVEMGQVMLGLGIGDNR